MPLVNLPEVEGLCLEGVVAEAQQISIPVATTAREARCPRCGAPSPRMHSRYQRTAAALLWANVTVRLLLHGRRFRCKNSARPRAILRFMPYLA